jgi:hypothetical protein
MIGLIYGDVLDVVVTKTVGITVGAVYGPANPLKISVGKANLSISL